MQPNQGYIKTGSAIRFVMALIMVLLVAVSTSWGACRPETCGSSTYTYADCQRQLAQSPVRVTWPSNYWQYFTRCQQYNDFNWNLCGYTCDIGSEALGDSLQCVYNPSADGCIQEQDTTIIACNENVAPDGSIYSQIYDCSCKAVNGQLTSCNGSTSVVPSRDCRLLFEKQGGCSRNGYQVGANPENHQSVGDCYAIFGSRCYFEDPRSKNTFSCECDGSCSYGLAQLAQGNCLNPYIKSSSSSGDTLSFSSSSGVSSSSENPSSSSSGVGSSGSGSGADSTGDLEYDYYNELGNIIANTQLINYNVEALNVKATTANEHLQSIDNKMTTNNDLLTQIANKDFSPQVNVNVSGDTAKSPALILKTLNGLIDSGEVDTSELLGGLNIGKLQSEQDSLNLYLGNKTDIFANCDTTGGKDCSGIFGIDTNKTKAELQGAFNGVMDSLNNGAFADSVKKWQSYLLPAELSGSGSNTCPAILQKTFPVIIGGISFTIPAIGSTGLCGSTIGGITYWQLVRILLRLFVGFSCLFAIYRCVVGLGEDK